MQSQQKIQTEKEAIHQKYQLKKHTCGADKYRRTTGFKEKTVNYDGNVKR
jgi:hypothetical protein